MRGYFWFLVQPIRSLEVVIPMYTRKKRRTNWKYTILLKFIRELRSEKTYDPKVGEADREIENRALMKVSVSWEAGPRKGHLNCNWWVAGGLVWTGLRIMISSKAQTSKGPMLAASPHSVAVQVQDCSLQNRSVPHCHANAWYSNGLTPVHSHVCPLRFCS